jgi:hypothetical protein
VKPAPAAHPGFVAAFTELVQRIAATLADVPPASRPIRMIVAGGAAMHLYTGARTSQDLDASFSHRLLLPKDLQAAYRGANGSPQTLYFDYQYNDAMGLQHEDAHQDSVSLELDGVDSSLLDVRLLTPVDLAISKLARFAEVDREDIRQLARDGLIDAASIRSRAEEALAGYIGNLRHIQGSIKAACSIVTESRL